ncbi:hypothetical protein C0J52_11934 [Blattella germanica]|nr:hypothetical protein C0J52_11934 [Blattella germanica]
METDLKHENALIIRRFNGQLKQEGSIFPQTCAIFITRLLTSRAPVRHIALAAPGVSSIIRLKDVVN